MKRPSISPMLYCQSTSIRLKMYHVFPELNEGSHYASVEVTQHSVYLILWGMLISTLWTNAMPTSPWNRLATLDNQCLLCISINIYIWLILGLQKKTCVTHYTSAVSSPVSLFLFFSWCTKSISYCKPGRKKFCAGLYLHGRLSNISNITAPGKSIL